MASLGDGASRRAQIVSAYQALHEHETTLTKRFLAGIALMPRVSLFGQPTSGGRTATFAINVEGVSPATAAKALGEAGCFVWAGDYYAFEVMHFLGTAPEGLVRIGFVHYNTEEEVDRVLAELSALS
jgi:selenocysteine lyase/cysteine desulfurase